MLKFAKDNLKYYRSMVENKDIPDNLLMCSFLQVIFSYAYIPNIKRTKKYNDVEWSFFLYEHIKNYDRKDFYISWNGFGDVEAHNIFGEAYPTGIDCYEIIHPVHKRLLATGSINGENLDSYSISKIA